MSNGTAKTHKAQHEVGPIIVAVQRDVRAGYIERAGHLARWAASEVARCR